MHLMITKTRYKDKEKKYAKIVQSYRDGATSRQQVILNLGPINSEYDERRFREILESMCTGNIFVKVNDIKALNAKEYGVTYTVNKIMEKYGIADVLKKELSQNKAMFDVYGVINALIINRLIKPSSDLAAYNWILNDYCEKLEIQQHHIYRALDYLIKRKDAIEKDIFDTLKKKMKLNTEIIHYDLTSSYFEGSHCTIALYGYSRDHRRDRPQIVLGLVMCDGIPIYHEINKGNTIDKTTLINMVENLKKKLGIKKPIFIADRGLLTEDNLITIEDEEYQYIIGVQRRRNNLSKKLLSKHITTEKNQFAKEIHQEQIERNEKTYTRRYILCQDNNTREDRLEKLKTIKKNIENKLTALQNKYFNSQKPSHKGRRMTRDGLMCQANKILGKNKRIFNIWFDNGLIFSLNDENYKYEEQIAGKFLLVTSTNKDANDVMKAYKELQIVENAFDEIKNFINLRPIGHYDVERVYAHTFICVLSFLIECIIEKFSSESPRKIIHKLQRIRIIELSMKEHTKTILVEPTKETNEIFKNLKIPKPVYRVM